MMGELPMTSGSRGKKKRGRGELSRLLRFCRFSGVSFAEKLIYNTIKKKSV